MATALQILISILLLAGMPAIAAQSLNRTEARQRFDRANQLYQNRQFKEALAEYNALIGPGIEDPALYYNAGNAYVQLNEKGEAVAMYERAKRLAPRDWQIQKNLAYIRPAQPPQPFVLARPFVWLRDVFTLNEWIVILEAFVFWIALAWALLLLLRHETARAAARFFLALGLVFGLATAAFVPWRRHVERGRRVGVIVREKVVSRHGPSPTLGEHLQLAEGTRVQILAGSSGDWLHVRPIDVPAKSAESTYVKREAVEEI